MRGFWYVSSLRKQLRRDRILLYVLSATCSFPQSAVTVSVSVLSLLHRKKSAFCGRGEGGWRGPGAGAGPPAATAGASALQPAGLRGSGEGERAGEGALLGGSLGGAILAREAVWGHWDEQINVERWMDQ